MNDRLLTDDEIRSILKSYGIFELRHHEQDIAVAQDQKTISALASQSEEGMILATDEIKEAFRTWPDTIPQAVSYDQWLCQAQLAKCKPIIEARARKEEREKCMRTNCGTCREMESPKCPYRNPDRPKIVCLCGSTRFTPLMMMMEWEYAKKGILAFGWFVRPVAKDSQEDHLAEKEGVHELFDELHKRKIDLADEVLVLNVGGYIGESTRSEINYAEAHGKPVRYLESLKQEGR